MRRNLVFLAVVTVSLILVFSSTRRILDLRTTSQKVDELSQYLEDLKIQNEQLRSELEYKRSERFAEEEIRNKLGLVKPGEKVVVIPRSDERRTMNDERKKEEPNYVKWWKLFFGG